jgi:hypothetical protein
MVRQEARRPGGQEAIFQSAFQCLALGELATSPQRSLV